VNNTQQGRERFGALPLLSTKAMAPGLSQYTVLAAAPKPVTIPLQIFRYQFQYYSCLRDAENTIQY